VLEAARELQRAAVVGGGTSGRGVARALASAGIEVVLVERTEDSLERSLRALREGMNRDIGRWALTEGERDAALARIRGAWGLPDLSGIRLLFEAIPEDLKEKRALLRELDGRAPPGCVFLLNTSTLSITGLAEAVSEARRPLVIGLHFLHPVTRIPLVELIRGRESGPRAEAAARALAARLGKEVMEVAEYPGYVTTRLTLALINEAVHVVMERIATRDAVDRAMKLRLGSTHGPLALADEIGLDSVHRALESLWHELGLPQFRPAPLLRRMVSEGWLGEKSGRGFYRYDETGRRLPEEEDLREPEVARFFGSGDPEGGEPPDRGES
jgi:3-hydroxybutyryl-CoA dehydrogenase